MSLDSPILADVKYIICLPPSRRCILREKYVFYTWLENLSYSYVAEKPLGGKVLQYIENTGNQFMINNNRSGILL